MNLLNVFTCCSSDFHHNINRILHTGRTLNVRLCNPRAVDSNFQKICKFTQHALGPAMASPHRSKLETADPEREVEARLALYRQRLQSIRASGAANQYVGTDADTGGDAAARPGVITGKPTARRTNSGRDDCPRHFAAGFEANIKADGGNHTLIELGREWTVRSVAAPHWVMGGDDESNAGRKLTVERPYLCSRRNLTSRLRGDCSYHHDHHET
jgi:hypothetical protein